LGIGGNFSNIIAADQVIKHDIIVIGASAGGVEALQELVRVIPQNLPAAVFVVVHLAAWAPTLLPLLLSRKGALPAQSPNSDELIQPGRIYVAPPDHHMILEDGRVHLWRGPKENLHRPAINTLFRSAAVEHRQRVVGVILTGLLDDGSAGLWWIKRYGGVTVVQDPAEALYPDMVRSALEYVSVDYVVRLSGMGMLLLELASGTAGPISATSRLEPAAEPIWKPRKQ
jgi:two-component system chemotaxis response regulator CheB